ncbi:MAG: DUF1638 domain-containing protein [Coriobacteriia bacterium]|nr:DUF1638 domain-containing protein [Coriobacteriia bacterium]
MLRLKIIACKALFRELSLLATHSTNIVDFTWLSWGLHDVIGGLSVALQNEINAIDSGEDLHTSYPPFDQPFDAILLGYGLCSNGVEGLSSSKYPLVIPRAHDCITLYLGSKERYQKLFLENGGTFWFSAGWIENSPMPGKKRHDMMVAQYAEKFDLETAEELVSIYEEWQENYTRLGKINWPEFAGEEFTRFHDELSRKCAEELGWTLEEFEGDSSLLRSFIAGNWDNERFLVVPPGKKVEASYREDIITIAE